MDVRMTYWIPYRLRIIVDLSTDIGYSWARQSATLRCKPFETKGSNIS
jgi:hypothetical protein